MHPYLFPYEIRSEKGSDNANESDDGSDEQEQELAVVCVALTHRWTTSSFMTYSPSVDSNDGIVCQVG